MALEGSQWVQIYKNFMRNGIDIEKYKPKVKTPDPATQPGGSSNPVDVRVGNGSDVGEGGTQPNPADRIVVGNNAATADPTGGGVAHPNPSTGMSNPGGLPTGGGGTPFGNGMSPYEYGGRFSLRGPNSNLYSDFINKQF